MPGLEVEWPTLDTTEQAAPDQSVQSQTPTQEEGGNRKYSLQIDGLGSVGESEDLLKAFRQQSALEADRKDAANAAQIARRSRADADLLEELLRSQGYYDADVEPRTESAGNRVRVVLEASPGEQYRFASVELPGLDAAGPEAAKLRDAFAVKAGDPVIAQDVIAGGLTLQTMLGELGFAATEHRCRRHHLSVQDAEHDRHRHVRRIGVPQAIAQTVQPTPVITRTNAVLLIQVRDVADLRDRETPFAAL